VGTGNEDRRSPGPLPKRGWGTEEGKKSRCSRVKKEKAYRAGQRYGGDPAGKGRREEKTTFAKKKRSQKNRGRGGNKGVVTQKLGSGETEQPPAEKKKSDHQKEKQRLRIN